MENVKNKIDGSLKNRSLSDSAKKPYTAPSIEEEETFDTLAMSCTLGGKCTGRGQTEVSSGQ